MTAHITQTVGSELKTLRVARGLSQNKLAGLARVSGAALSRWESGQRIPSIPELDATLMALDASDAQKRDILRLINAPRALHKLRAIDTDGFEPYTSGGGQLFWAMRKRRGWTQTETARAAGVLQSQVARWERGEAWPDDQTLHALCWALRARSEEVAALTGGALVGSGQGALAPNAEIETWDEARWMAYIPDLQENPPPDALTDLTFIQAEQQLAQMAHRHAFAAALLPDVYAIHARPHLAHRRFSEGAKWAEQGFALLQRDGLESKYSARAPLWFGNVLTLVFHLTSNKRPASLRRGAALIQNWLPILRQRMSHRNACPEARESAVAYYAWGKMTLAEIIGSLGRPDEALMLGAESCENAERIRPSEASLRWRDYAGLLHAAGHSARALDALSKSQSMVRWDYATPDTVARQHLSEAKYLIALDDLPGASERLREAERIIENANLRHLEPDLQSLARKCV